MPAAGFDDPELGLPIGLGPAQLGDEPVRRAGKPIAVLVWVPFTSGRHVRVHATAGEWTSKAVRIRWRDSGRTHDIWVWATAVTRRPPSYIIGVPATHNPALRAARGSEREPSRTPPQRRGSSGVHVSGSG